MSSTYKLLMEQLNRSHRSALVHGSTTQCIIVLVLLVLLLLWPYVEPIVGTVHGCVRRWLITGARRLGGRWRRMKRKNAWPYRLFTKFKDRTRFLSGLSLLQIRRILTEAGGKVWIGTKTVWSVTTILKALAFRGYSKMMVAKRQMYLLYLERRVAIRKVYLFLRLIWRIVMHIFRYLYSKLPAWECLSIGLHGTFLVLATIVYLPLYYYRLFRPCRWTTNWNGWLITYFSEQRIDHRRTFKNCRVDRETKHTPAAHTHFDAASDRSKGDMLAMIFSSLIGKETFSVSKSVGEDHTLKGNHKYYCAKDLQMNLRRDTWTREHVLKMTDVDYYCDMQEYLQGNDVILVTFVPEKAGGSCADSVYCIDEFNTIKMTVQGGAQYEHQIWDYDNDHLIVDHWWGSCLYLIEQRSVGDMKRVIFLNCKRIVYGPFAWGIPGYRLQRKKFCFADNIVYIQRVIGHSDKTTVSHSLGYVNRYSSVEIPDDALTACLGMMRGKPKSSSSDCQRILIHAKVVDHGPASIMVHRLLAMPDFFPEVRPLTESLAPTGGYQALGPLILEEGREVHRVLTPPLLDGGVCPKSSYNNDVACIADRITRVKNKVIGYPPFVWVCMQNFIEMLIPEGRKHSLSPDDYETQSARFNRPSQRAKVEQVADQMFHDSGFVVRSFQKAEFYSKVTGPRNISTLPMGHNFRYGQYVNAFVDEFLKDQDWYAFGKHPQVIEKRIRDLAAKYDHMIPTDIHRADGSWGYFLECLMIAVMMRAFDYIFHEEVSKFPKTEANVKGYTKHGEAYEADDSTLSGSTATSLRTTLGNAFINFTALRYSGMTKEQAWEHLGIYGGDDGLAVALKKDGLESTFATMGIQLKAEVIAQGDPVPFLGRIYLDPWTCSDSIIDVKRQMTKLHVTVAPITVPGHVAMSRKVIGYRVTDPHTPVIRQWCNAMDRIFPMATSEELEKYAHETREDVTYWAKFESPFSTLERIDLAKTVIAAELGATVAELEDYIAKLDLVNTLDDMKTLHTMIHNEVKVELPALIDGVIVEGAPKDHRKILEENKAKMPPENLAIQKKTRNMKIPNDVRFAPRPSLDAPLRERARAAVRNDCKYSVKGIPCPYKNKCKFFHAPKRETAAVISPTK